LIDKLVSGPCDFFPGKKKALLDLYVERVYGIVIDGDRAKCESRYEVKYESGYKCRESRYLIDKLVSSPRDFFPGKKKALSDSHVERVCALDGDQGYAEGV
jgi:hypothetical protein